MIALGLVAICGACSYALLARGGGGAASPARGPRAAAVGPQKFAPSQFWYTRTVRSMHQWLPAGGITTDRRGYIHWRGPHVQFDLRVSEETWVGVDGTLRDRMIVAGVRFAYPGDRAKWAAYGQPVPDFNHVWLGWMSHDGITVGGDRFPPGQTVSWGEWVGPSGWDVADGLFSYPQLMRLPIRPTALRARLSQAEKALARREDRTGADVQGLASATGPLNELTDIADLLTTPVPAAVRLGLVHAAITMPGARVNPHARDSLGRTGVAVSTIAGAALQRLIVDPATGALLEDAPGVTVVAQGSVDSAYALPKGLSPVGAAGAPPQPETPAISPAVGNPTTIFKVNLPAPVQRRSRRAPVLDWLLLGTPGTRCLAGFLPRLPPLMASASDRLAGSLTDVYKIGPGSVHRRSWCPGRYELTVLPDYSHRPSASQLPPSTSPDYGSSIFFRVS